MSSIKDKHFETVEEFYVDNLDIMAGKNADYAEDDDPWSNFRFASLAAGITVEQGFLYLKGLKLARLKNLLVNAKEPVNESISDTLGDDSNYGAICHSYLTHKNSTDPSYAYAGDAGDEQPEEPEQLIIPFPNGEMTVALNTAPVEPPNVVTPEQKDRIKRLLDFFKKPESAEV